jgi:hypothetical protein
MIWLSWLDDDKFCPVSLSYDYACLEGAHCAYFEESISTVNEWSENTDHWALVIYISFSSKSLFCQVTKYAATVP